MIRLMSFVLFSSLAISASAGNSAALTIGGTVLPQANVSYPTEVSVSNLSGSKNSQIIAVVQCDQTLSSKVFVDCATTHEVLSGKSAGATLVYAVDSKEERGTVSITIVNE